MINEIERRCFWYDMSKTQKITHDEYNNPVINLEDDIDEFLNENEIPKKEPVKTHQNEITNKFVFLK